MTTWFSGHGWGWCGLMVNLPATVLLWGAVLTATALAARFAAKGPSDPSAPRGTGQAPPHGTAAVRVARGATDNDDEFYRRLM